MPLLVGHDQVGVEPEVGGASTDETQPHRLLEESHVETLDVGDLLGGVLDQVGEAVQHRGPFFDGEPAPGREAVDCGADRSPGRGCVTPGEVGQVHLVPVDRRTTLERV